MAIVREVMGNMVKIELTEAEKREIYDECRHKMMAEEIEPYMVEKYDMDKIPHDLMNQIVCTFRNEYNNFVAHSFSVEDLANSVIANYEQQLEAYKVNLYKCYAIEAVCTTTHTYYIKAKSEEEAQNLFDAWSEKHSHVMESDMADEISNGEWSYESVYEEDEYDMDNADIKEE